MGRAKKKKKKLLKLKRKKKKIPFTLSNSPKKYSGIKNRFCEDNNIHNICYKGGKFENVRYQNSNITECNFKLVNLNGVDFNSVNLKKTSFKDSTIKNCIFFKCNLKKTDFTGAKFENVYFITCNIEKAINLEVNTSNILKTYPKINLSSKLNLLLKILGTKKYIRKTHLLHVKSNKNNNWIISILLKTFTEEHLEKAFFKLMNEKNLKNLYTVRKLNKFIENNKETW